MSSSDPTPWSIAGSFRSDITRRHARRRSRAGIDSNLPSGRFTRRVSAVVAGCQGVHGRQPEAPYREPTDRTFNRPFNRPTIGLLAWLSGPWDAGRPRNSGPPAGPGRPRADRSDAHNLPIASREVAVGPWDAKEFRTAGRGYPPPADRPEARPARRVVWLSDLGMPRNYRQPSRVPTDRTLNLPTGSRGVVVGTLGCQGIQDRRSEDRPTERSNCPSGVAVSTLGCQGIQDCRAWAGRRGMTDLPVVRTG